MLTDEQLAFAERAEKHLNIEFQNKGLLLAALTHASGAQTSLDSNERLEFLGDAVLGFCVCCYLFETYPSWNEGELTKVKSAVVSRQACFRWAKQLNLEELIVVGKGIPQTRSLPKSLLANGFEALVAAIYLDRGLEVARDFLLPLINSEIEAVLQCSVANNFKSALQHLAQRDFGSTPTYSVLEESGPDHDKSFLIAAKLDQREFPPAWGRSKKEAEQLAAEIALKLLENPDG